MLVHRKGVFESPFRFEMFVNLGFCGMLFMVMNLFLCRD